MACAAHDHGGGQRLDASGELEATAHHRDACLAAFAQELQLFPEAQEELEVALALGAIDEVIASGGLAAVKIGASQIQALEPRLRQLFQQLADLDRGRCALAEAWLGDEQAAGEEGDPEAEGELFDLYVYTDDAGEFRLQIAHLTISLCTVLLVLVVVGRVV